MAIPSYSEHFESVSSLITFRLLHPSESAGHAYMDIDINNMPVDIRTKGLILCISTILGTLALDS